MYKKIRLFILGLILLIPFSVFANEKIVKNTNHTGDVYIASSELVKIGDEVEEISSPTLKDLNIKFNIRFLSINQSVQYKLIIKNDSSKDYKVVNENNFKNSDYIDYQFKFDNGSDIIKANSEEEMLVTITYKKQVPSDKLVNGKFVEDNTMSLNLSNQISNPLTVLQRYVFPILLIIVVGVSVIYFLKHKNIKKSLKVLLIGLILIPVTAKAIDAIKISIDSHIEIDTTSNNLLYRKIISAEASDSTYETGIKEIEAKGSPDFSKTATTDEGMYTMKDDYGTSYYYRGAVPDNWVSFAGFLWRIIRVNGDNTVRMIYSGTTSSHTGEGTQLWPSDFNSSNDSPKYVGYMYGDSDTTESEAFTNKNDSTIKEYIDNWYKNNLSSYSSLIADEAFCNDRTLASGSTYSTSSEFEYAANEIPYIPYTNKRPQLTCPNLARDGFTTTTASIGNKALTYPVGLITADEISLAGGVWFKNNNSYYLNTGQWYWTLSPSYWGSAPAYAYMFNVCSSGGLKQKSVRDYDISVLSGVRPVVSLKTSTLVTKGTGTETDPYVVG